MFSLQVQSEDIRFMGQPPKDWLGPLNWNYEDTYLNDASPYVQRVPCADDHVVFPKVRNIYNKREILVFKPIKCILVWCYPYT